MTVGVLARPALLADPPALLPVAGFAVGLAAGLDVVELLTVRGVGVGKAVLPGVGVGNAVVLPGVGVAVAAGVAVASAAVRMRKL